MSAPHASALVRFLPCLAAAALLVALPLAAGELYQWKDANGVTHYSDAPPPSGTYKNRRIHDGGTAGTAAEASEKAPAESSQCTTARANLALLEGDGPVGIDSDGDGKPDNEMSADQRGAQKQLAEAAIKVHCSPAAQAQ